MKALLIQFRRKKQAQEREVNNFKRIFAMFDLQIDLDVVNGIKSEINHIDVKKYDRILMGGSELSFEGENEPEEIRHLAKQMTNKFNDFVRDLVDKNTPSLAICFSHQLFGAIFNSNVKRDKCLGKVGSFKVSIKSEYEKDLIFKDMQKEFYANYMHQDVLCASPSNAIVLANGERCKCAVLKYGENSYTTQFHPELTKQALDNLLDMFPHYARFEQKDKTELLKDVSESHKIIKNFFTVI